MAKLEVAPMLGLTDKYYRCLMRVFLKKTYLYTEMLHANALIHKKHDDFINFTKEQSPLCLQIAGSNPKDLALVAKILRQKQNIKELNFNLGCPSAKVQSGNFGAILYKDKNLSMNCMSALLDNYNKKISVKIRIGVDEINSYEYLSDFVYSLKNIGIKKFIIHARCAFLKGLNPKQNRNVPPLNYPFVYKIKDDFPDLEIIINGEINNLLKVKNALEKVDGVMIGRKAYSDPMFLHKLETIYFKEKEMQKKEILEAVLLFLEKQKNIKLYKFTRHLTGFFNGQENAKKWRHLIAKSTNNNFNFIKEAKKFL